MTRTVFVFLVCLSAMVAVPRPASAGVVYCKSDPVIQLNGALVDIALEIPLTAINEVTGPVVYEVVTHRSITGGIVVSDPGYNGHGMQINFKSRRWGLRAEEFLTTVKVEVPIARRVRTVLTVTPVSDPRRMEKYEGWSDGLTQVSVWVPRE